MTIAYRGTGTSAHNTASVLTFTITLPTGWQPGDLLFLVAVLGKSTPTGFSQTGGTGTWTLDFNASYAGGPDYNVVAHRVMQAGDTAPTFTWTNTARYSWSCGGFFSSTGGTLSLDKFAASDPVQPAAGTSVTANAATTAGGGEASVILTTAIASAITTAVGHTYTPPSGWTWSDGDAAFQADATNAARFAAHAYQLGVSGTVTPGAETLTDSTSDTFLFSVYHALVSETPGAAAGLLPQPGGTAFRRRYRRPQQLPPTFTPAATAPPFYPLGHPVQARQYPVPQGGHTSISRGRTGPYAQQGPPAHVWGAPAQARQPLPPRGGRTSGRAGSYAQAGPPAKVWNGPVHAQPGPQRGGRIASRDGTFTAPGTQASVRSSSTYASAATEASFTMPLPAGFAAGDVCWIFVELRAANGVLGAAPSGWTTVAASFASGSSTSSCEAVYRKVMAGGETNPVITGTSGRFSAVAVAVQNADNITPEDVAAIEDGNGAASSTTITSPGVTAAAASDLLLIGFGCGTPGSAQVITFGAPSGGMSLVASISTTVAAVTESGMMVASQALSSSGATGTRSTTITPSAVNGQTVTIGVRSATTAQAGPPVHVWDAPIQSRQQPLRGGHTTTRTGLFAQQGPPAHVWDGPLQARQPLPARGRATGHAGIYAQAGPPARIWNGPVRARIPAPPSGGRATSHAGIRAQLGPPARIWDAPLQARRQPEPQRGRIVTRAGTFVFVATGAGPPIYPLGHPVTARRFPTRGGSVTARDGVYSQAGPQVRIWNSPAQARQPLPPHGRAVWRSGTWTFVATGSGPPIYPLGHPVQARRQPLQGGHSAARDGTFAQQGPPVRPASGPVRARQPLPPAGHAQGRAGTFSPPPVQAALAPPLHSPVQARRQPLTGGRVIRRAGVYAQAGPPVKALPGPAGLGRRQPPPPTRGRAAWQRGPYAQAGPPVKALPGPVRSRVPGPFRSGRTRTTLLPPVATPPPLIAIATGIATVSDPREGTATLADLREGFAGVTDPRDGTMGPATDGREGSASVSDPRDGTATHS